MGKAKSAKWLLKHQNDFYVKERIKRKLRARSAFKLEQVNKTQKFLTPKTTVVDLGAAPGGWAEICVQNIGLPSPPSSGIGPKPRPYILGIDLLPIKPLEGCYFLTEDFTYEDICKKVLVFFNSKVDVVLSDVAPSRTGLPLRDHYRQIELCWFSLFFAEKVLKTSKNSIFLLKVFQGPEEDEFMKVFKNKFQNFKVVKPLASRKSSNEVYYLGRGLLRTPSSESETS